MEDRSQAFAEICDRMLIRKAFQEAGIMFDVQQSLIIQLCIQQAKEDPKLSTKNIIENVCKRFSR